MIRLQIFLTVLAVTAAFPDRPRPPYSLNNGDDDDFGQGNGYQIRPAQPLSGSGPGPRPQQPSQIYRAAPAPLPANPPGQSRYSAPPPEPTPYRPPSPQVPVSPVYTATFGQDQTPHPPQGPPSGYQPQPPNYPDSPPTPWNYQNAGSDEDDCPGDYVRDANGNCVQPEIFRDLFVYQEPEKDDDDSEDVPLPKPKVKLNLLVIKTNDDEEDDGPIIVEQEEKTIVLVLSEKGQNGPKKVIEVPAQSDQSPEVFFIDYVPGDNSLLPGGIYLQDALKYATDVDDDSDGLYPGYPSISPDNGPSFPSTSSQTGGGNRYSY